MYRQPAGSSEFPPNHSRTRTRRAKALARVETPRAGYFSLLASIVLAALAMHGFPTG